MFSRAGLAFVFAGSIIGVGLAIPAPASARVSMATEPLSHVLPRAKPSPEIRRSRRIVVANRVRHAGGRADGDPGDPELDPLGATKPEQVGIASWYGGARWQGRPMSDGSRYVEDDLTAAHATLPLGSWARVRLVGDGHEVVVRITDRPGTRRRIIDLSRGAASALGILSRGIARVSVQPL